MSESRDQHLMSEEHALTLLQKAECDRLSATEAQWLEQWLRGERGWLQRLLASEVTRLSAPSRLRARVRRAIREVSRSE